MRAANAKKVKNQPNRVSGALVWSDPQIEAFDKGEQSTKFS